MREVVSDNKGVALLMAVMGMLLVTLTAAMILNLTMRRFESTSFRSDRMITFNATEGGTQYAWSRLQVNDTRRPINPASGIRYGPPGLTFQQRVQNKAPAPFVISSDPAVNPDHWEQALWMGSRHVTIEVLFDSARDDFGGTVPGAEYQIRTWADYGT